MKNNKLAIILVVIVALFIIILATITNLNKDKKEEKKAQVLNCEKLARDNYTIKYTIDYSKEKANLSYTDNKKLRDSSNYSETKEEIDNYSKLDGIGYKYVDDTITITIDKNTLNKNKKNQNVKRLFEDYNKLKKYLENKEFECN